MSGELEVIDEHSFDKIQEVADLHVQGFTPYVIAKRLGIKAAVVKDRIDDWNMMLREDSAAKDIARDYLNRMIKHYDELIIQARKNLEDLGSLAYDEKVSAQKNATIKTVADLEAKRLDFIQKAGLLDNSELADELAEREDREEAIINILQNKLCRDCQDVVRSELSRLTGIVPGTVSEGD